MIDGLIDALFFWSMVALLSQTIHLLVGWRSVGASEVQRQLTAFIEEYGYSGWMLHAFTFGFLPRGELELDRGDPA